MASWMDVPIHLHIRIPTLRLISDRGGERRGEGGGRGRGGIEIDGSIVLGSGNVTGGEENGTGTKNENENEAGSGTRGRRTSIAGTTVARGNIGGERTNGVVRLLPLTDLRLSLMDANPHRYRRLTRTRKKASE